MAVAPLFPLFVGFVGRIIAQAAMARGVKP
jgi:hypothetical protein